MSELTVFIYTVAISNTWRPAITALISNSRRPRAGGVVPVTAGSVPLPAGSVVPVPAGSIVPVPAGSVVPVPAGARASSIYDAVPVSNTYHAVITALIAIDSSRHPTGGGFVPIPAGSVVSVPAGVRASSPNTSTVAA